MQNRSWTREETVLALYLYFQLPFGKLHSGNPEIQDLAFRIERTNSSVAMKLANFASLDPKIVESGRKGLAGATKLDREVFASFQSNWTALVAEAEKLILERKSDSNYPNLSEMRSEFGHKPYDGPSSVERLMEQRVGQSFFRRSVLANFDEHCCITGISDRRLLNASHIVPWSDDVGNRHNPSNGLSLSATFDRAFDRGLLTVRPGGIVEISAQLSESDSLDTREYFRRYQGVKIRQAVRFRPDDELLRWHNEVRYVG
jgi:putative restriction endonuclease